MNRLIQISECFLLKRIIPQRAEIRTEALIKCSETHICLRCLTEDEVNVGESVTLPRATAVYNDGSTQKYNIA